MARFRPRNRRRSARLLRLGTTVFVATFIIVMWGPAMVANLQSAARQTAIQQPAVTADTFVCNVASITDGDTLRCRDGTRIRLHAISARETDETCSPGHPCPAASAMAATEELTRLAAGRQLSCERVGRSYNRVTAICADEAGLEINCAMVRSGTAELWDRFNAQRAICR